MFKPPLGGLEGKPPLGGVGGVKLPLGRGGKTPPGGRGVRIHGEWGVKAPPPATFANI